MDRRIFCKLGAISAASPWLTRNTYATDTRQHHLLDMVHLNPGEPSPKTVFLDPAFVRKAGFDGDVIQSPIEGVALFDSIAPGTIASGSVERRWAEDTTVAIGARIQAMHDAGLKVYAWMQLAVLPKAIMKRFRAEICDAQNRIDVERPRTRELLAIQLNEILDRFPLLDGFVIRTGEVYLQDLPYHASGGDTEGTELIQQSTAILNGERSHIALLKLLRDEVCAKRNRNVFYRTWDFGNFHTQPDYYLRVTEAIEPHPKLAFSIKHQAGDFHQLTPFNPTLTLGRHPQIVEVQCQREGYGKGAHPYYIGSGVIDGWEDMAWINPPSRPTGLRGIAHDPQFAGVWTWSRGGGWEGPYIKNDLWCRLNALTMALWSNGTGQSEARVFSRASTALGVLPESVAAFRELNLLSAKAVLRGQLTAIRTPQGHPIQLDVWWARDDKLDAPDLRDFIRRGLVERSIAEKREAVAMWGRIVTLSKQVKLHDPEDEAFVRSSCVYGLMKYSIIAEGWTALLLGQLGAATKNYDRPRIAAAIHRWDALWEQWHQIAAADPLCSTLVRPQAFDVHFQYKPGLAAAIDALRSTGQARSEQDDSARMSR